MLDTSLRRAVRTMVGLGIGCALAGAAHATPITYTLRGTASGAVGAKSFTNARFVVTATGDTAAVSTLAPGVPCNDALHATFTIDGAGGGAITTPLSVADNSAWQLLALARGRCAESGPMWANGRNPHFEAYDLASDVSPMALTMPSAPPGVSMQTSQGVLSFSSVSALAFEADVAAPTAVPTLSGTGLGLLAAAMAAVGAVNTRRRRRAA